MNWLIPVLCALTIVSAVAATFLLDIRRAALSLWLTGLLIGGLYLALGAEVLAMIQWILATLSVMCFLFHAVMFGEYANPQPMSWTERITRAAAPLLAGMAFTSIIYLGFSSRREGTPDLLAGDFPLQGLEKVGKELVEKHLLSVEVLSLTLFLVVVGVGVIARAEWLPTRKQEEETP
jgi:NADH:ubiquinone oxidoreductase subunit 6 (subunit J)